MFYKQNQMLQQFTKDHIAEYLEFAIPSYVQHSPYFAHGGVAVLQKFKKDTVDLLNVFIEAAERVNKERDTRTFFNTFIEVDGRMVVACFSCDLHEFLNVVINEVDYEFIHMLPQNFAEGVENRKALVNMRHVVRNDCKRQGFFQQHLKMRAQHLFNQGFESSYAWIVSPVVLKVYSNLDYSELVQKYEDQKQNKILTVYFVREDLKRLAIRERPCL